MWDRWDQRVRDTILFTVGVVGVVNELFVVDEPRAYALMFLGSLIGMPFVLSAEKSKESGKEPE